MKNVPATTTIITFASKSNGKTRLLACIISEISFACGDNHLSPYYVFPGSVLATSDRTAHRRHTTTHGSPVGTRPARNSIRAPNSTVARSTTADVPFYSFESVLVRNETATVADYLGSAIYSPTRSHVTQYNLCAYIIFKYKH